MGAKSAREPALGHHGGLGPSGKCQRPWCYRSAVLYADLNDVFSFFQDCIQRCSREPAFPMRLIPYGVLFHCLSAAYFAVVLPFEYADGSDGRNFPDEITFWVHMGRGRPTDEI